MPLALLLLAHRQLAVDVPYGGDDWWFLDVLYRPWLEGGLRLADLFALHHEHRCALPFALMLGISRVSAYSVGALQMAFVACMLGLLAILWREARFLIRPCSVFVLAPLPLLLLAPRQWEQVMLVGFGLTFAVPLLVGVGSFAALASADRHAGGAGGLGRLASAVLLAFCASISAAFGLLVWPIGLFQLLLASRPGRQRWLVPAVWAAAGAFAVFAYLRGWSMVAPPNEAGTPGKVLLWFVSCLGSSLVDEPYAARVIGMMLLVFSVVAVFSCLVERRLRAASFWVACLAYSFGTLAATTFGRAGYGYALAFTSRFAVFGSVFVSALYILLLPGPAHPCRIRRTYLAAAVAALVVLGSSRTFAQMAEENAFDGFASRRHLAAFRLFTQDAWTDSQLSGTFDAPADRIRRVSRFLQERRLSVFRWMPAEFAQATASRADEDPSRSARDLVTAFAEPSVRGRWLLVQGCVVLSGTKEAPRDEVRVTVDGRPFLTFRGTACPDASPPSQDLLHENAGFAFALPRSSIPALREVRVGAELWSPNGRRLEFFGPETLSLNGPGEGVIPARPPVLR